MVKMVDMVYVIILEDDTFFKDGGTEGNMAIISVTQVHEAQFFSKKLASIKSLELIDVNRKNKVLPLVLTVVPNIIY